MLCMLRIKPCEIPNVDFCSLFVISKAQKLHPLPPHCNVSAVNVGTRFAFPVHTINKRNICKWYTNKPLYTKIANPHIHTRN